MLVEFFIHINFAFVFGVCCAYQFGALWLFLLILYFVSTFNPNVSVCEFWCGLQFENIENEIDLFLFNYFRSDKK